MRLFLNKEQSCCDQQNTQEDCVNIRKFPKITFAMAGVKHPKFAKCDQTGKGCNQCSCAADIHTQQQRTIIQCEPREQNRRRNITDHLARHCRNQQRFFLKHRRNQRIHALDPRQISCKNKEEKEQIQYIKTVCNTSSRAWDHP